MLYQESIAMIMPDMPCIVIIRVWLQNLIIKTACSDFFNNSVKKSSIRTLILESYDFFIYLKSGRPVGTGTCEMKW